MTMANVDYWRTFRDFTTNAAVIADQAQDVVTFQGGDNIRLSFNEGDDIITWHADLPGIIDNVTGNISVINDTATDPSMLDYDPTTATFTYHPPDLSNYATLSYVDSAVASGVANVDLTGYATEVWVQGYVGTAVNVPDLDEYVTKQEYNDDYIAINVKLDEIAANAVGYTGSAGQDGSSVKIVGSVPEYATLTTLPRWTNYLGQKGDGVILEDTGNLAVATIITPYPTVWEDVGPIIGYTGSRGAKGFDGSRGDTGYTGSAIVVGHTVFEQNVASNFWAINHNLGVQYLSVELVDASSNSIVGTYGYPTVTFVDDNNLTISWTQPATGYAVLSAGGGEQGNVGFTGSQGYDGSRGFTGSIGFTGSSGAFAALGFTGSTGAQGIQGYTGSQGNIGFTGSISTVPGPIGFTGSQGNVGFNGSIGDQGVIGYTGSQGNIGYTGSQGNTGFTGSASTVAGPIGFSGSRGYNGSIGAQGGTGFVGSQGDQGNVGFTGSQGVIGYTGSQGVTGLTGSASADVTTVYTFSTLPVPSTGDRYFISDSSVAAATNFGGVASDGGANTIPVYYDGAVWRIG